MVAIQKLLMGRILYTSEVAEKLATSLADNECILGAFKIQ